MSIFCTVQLDEIIWKKNDKTKQMRVKHSGPEESVDSFTQPHFHVQFHV